MKLLLVLLLFTMTAFAQTLGQFNNSLMSSHIQSGSYLTGDILFNDIKLRGINPPNNFLCLSDGLKYKPAKTTEWNLILTAQVAPRDDYTVTDNSLSGNYLQAETFQNVYSGHEEYQDLTKYNASELFDIAGSLNSEFGALAGGDVNPINTYSMLLINSAVQNVNVNPEQYNDYKNGGSDQISTFMANNIKAQNFTEDQVLQTISRIKSALYQNYNNPRNFSDEADNNNRYLSQQLNGFIDYSKTGELNNNGGVCDDIAAIGCDIYNKIYPDKDCLVFNIAATDAFHEVMVVGDGTEDYTVVDGGNISRVQGATFLSSNVTESENIGREQAMNIRVQMVEDGKLKDMYVHKTEYGTFMDELMSNPNDPSQSVNADLDAKNYYSVMFKALGEVVKENDIINKKKMKQKGFDLGGGTTRMLDGEQVIAVYARYNKYFDKEKLSGFNITLANSTSSKNSTSGFNLPNNTDGYSISGTNEHSWKMNRTHLNMGLNIGKVIYKDANWNVSAQGYTTLNLMFGVGEYNRTVESETDINGSPFLKYAYGNKSYSGVSGDGDLEVGGLAQMKYKSNSGNTLVNASVQPRFQAGSNNYSGMHNFLGDASALKHLKLRYQQVDANVNVQQKLGQKTTLVSNNSYRNTNIGSLLSNTVGVKVNAPSGVEYKVYVGNVAPLKGNKTNQNWLSSPANKGVLAGGEVNIKNKVSVKGSVNYDYTQKKTFFQFGTTIRPFKIKKRKPAKFK